jgi:hypothetical protein
VVKRWYDRAKLSGAKWGEVWGEFAGAYRKVKVPASQGALPSALARAQRVEPPDWLLQIYPDDPRLLRLALFCRELQQEAKQRGNAAFCLGCRDAGKAIGVSHNTALKLLHCLDADGVLKLSKVGTAGKALGGEANEFIWLGRPAASCQHSAGNALLVGDEPPAADADPTNVQNARDVPQRDDGGHATDADSFFEDDVGSDGPYRDRR